MLTLGLQLIEGGVGNFLLQYNVLSYVAVNILFYIQHYRMYVLNLSLALLSLVEQVSYETSSSEVLYSHTVSGKSLKCFFPRNIRLVYVSLLTRFHASHQSIQVSEYLPSLLFLFQLVIVARPEELS